MISELNKRRKAWNEELNKIRRDMNKDIKKEIKQQKEEEDG